MNEHDLTKTTDRLWDFNLFFCHQSPDYSLIQLSVLQILSQVSAAISIDRVGPLITFEIEKLRIT